MSGNDTSPHPRAGDVMGTAGGWVRWESAQVQGQHADRPEHHVLRMWIRPTILYRKPPGDECRGGRDTDRLSRRVAAESADRRLYTRQIVSRADRLHPRNLHRI